MSYYYAFFSDTDVDYSARFLFLVRPGDTIAASLVLHDDRWTVSIRDTRSRAHRLFRTNQEGRGVFNQAEWTQEDVTNSLTDRPLPYPSLSAVRFWGLRVNGDRPDPEDLLATWMNEHGRFLGPNPFVGDSFKLGPRLISPTAAQYLQISAPEYEVTAWFDTQAERWQRSTPEVEIDAERSALINAMQQEASQLQGVTWPEEVQPLIAALIQARQGEIAYLQTAPTLTQTGISLWITGLENLAPVAAGAQLGKSLNLPGILPYSS